MDERYREHALLFKALSDPNRLMAVDMLSCGELCACVLLEKFQITQPTLSHHMKTLCDCGLVVGRKEGKWVYYSLDKQTVQKCQAVFKKLAAAAAAADADADDGGSGSCCGCDADADDGGSGCGCGCG